VVRFTLKPGHEGSFDRLVAETLPRIRDAEPGTLIYACHEVHGAPSERVFYEMYRDHDAFETHERQPHVRRFLAEREQHLARMDVEFLTLDDAIGIPQGGE